MFSDVPGLVSVRDMAREGHPGSTTEGAAAGATPITRLQLAVSRFEKLQRRVLPFFCGGSWMHYGNDGVFRPPTGGRRVLIEIKRRLQGQAPLAVVSQAYTSTNFAPWVFDKGDQLEFEDNTLQFIFCEHFFEHLFFDQATALLRECRRVLRPEGVIRIVVPDAELRIYEAPEAPGFPSRSMPFTDPKKHKTRWSVYMLAETMELVGLAAHPLVYCTKDGRFVSESPTADDPFYQGVADPLVFTLDYVQRPKSLIIDARKESGA